MESHGSYSRGAEDDMNGLDATELRLGLPGTSSLPSSVTKKTRRLLDEEEPTVSHWSSSSGRTSYTDHQQEELSSTRPAKSQVVGWPPVQAFRKNAFHSHHGNNNAPLAKKESSTVPRRTTTPASSTAILVKVSMDGAPYQRKIDLGAYNGYKDLHLALDAMFCFSGVAASNQHGMVTYEDKDGDWMLVGDVPWSMFADSCKRLRIVKASLGKRA